MTVEDIKDELGWYNTTGRTEDIEFVIQKLMDVIDTLMLDATVTDEMENKS